MNYNFQKVKWLVFGEIEEQCFKQVHNKVNFVVYNDISLGVKHIVWKLITSEIGTSMEVELFNKG